jgi:hypothetical protein
MATPLGQVPSGSSEGDTSAARFGAGLTEAEVRRFQVILREQCGHDVPLPEAWSRAIELLSLVEMLLQWRGVLGQERSESPEFALPRS